LLVFQNTFEYCFIAYETIRSRWNPLRWGFKFWLIVAGAIWVYIKLPQEYWLHIAELDVTDTIRDLSWFGPALAAAIIGLIAILVFVVRPRLPQGNWSVRLAADPLPAAIAEESERAAFQARHRKVFDEAALEKIFLIGLISVIYGRVLPGVEATSLQIFLSVGFHAVVNAAIGLWAGEARSLVAVGWGVVPGRLRDQHRHGRSRGPAADAGRRPPAADRHAVLRLLVQHSDHAVRPLPSDPRLPCRGGENRNHGLTIHSGVVRRMERP
jgi:hypothetical protein